MAGLVAGIATAWTATPGPAMAIGLSLAGITKPVIPRLIQPVAVLAYGLGVVLSEPGILVARVISPFLLGLLAWTTCASIAGLFIRGKLKERVMIRFIRLVSFIAGGVLLGRAGMILLA